MLRDTFMSIDELVTWILGGINMFTGGFIKWLWSENRRLQDSDSALLDRVNKLELTVVGDYIKRAEFTHAMAILYEKLDKIYDKLEEKQDKKL